VQDHPWQRWAEDKRENVLNRMAKAVVKYVDWGVGHSYTKADFDEHVRNSPARAVAKEPIAEEYVTFAIQRCGGSFAEWRAANSRDEHLRFVFDNSSPREKRDIAKVFFGAANNRGQHEGGIEQWFNPDDVAYESRRVAHQFGALAVLLAGSASGVKTAGRTYFSVTTKRITPPTIVQNRPMTIWLVNR